MPLTCIEPWISIYNDPRLIQQGAALHQHILVKPASAAIALHTHIHLHTVPYPPTHKPTQSSLLFSLALSLSSLSLITLFHGVQKQANRHLFSSLDQHSITPAISF